MSDYEVIWDLSAGTAPAGSAASPVPQEELDLLQATDLLACFDARRMGLIRSPASRIALWKSRGRPGAVRPAVSTSSEPEGLFWGIKPGGTAREEIRDGIDASGVAIVGAHNKKATGNSTFVVPPGDFQLVFYARILVTASSTPLIGTVDTSTPFVILKTSDGRLRAYVNYSSSPIQTNTGVILDNVNQKIAFKYDSVGKLAQIEVDGVVGRSYVAFDLSSKVGLAFQFGQVTNGGSSILAGAGFAAQLVLLTSSTTDTTPGLADAVLAARAA